MDSDTRKELSGLFCNNFTKQTGIRQTKLAAKSAYALMQKRWWQPAERMLEQVDWNIDRAIEISNLVIDKMRLDGLTFDSPASIETLFKQSAGEEYLREPIRDKRGRAVIGWQSHSPDGE